MATDLSSQLAEYHAFVKSALSKGGSIDADATPAAFLEYQRQLHQLRETLRPAMERCQGGEPGEEIEIEQFVDEVIRTSPRGGEHG
jgi:hypothetical protein